MTITYPRELPFSGSIFDAGSSLDLSRSDASNRDAGGMVEVMEIGDPLWTLKLVTKPERPTKRATWKAWAASLQGGIQLFYGYHPILQYPIAYGVNVLSLIRAAGGAFDGTATLGTPGAFTLPLTGLPAAYVASAGDMISVALSTGSRMLHVVTQGGTASGGGALTVTVQPPVRLETVNGSTAVQLVRAKGLFVLDQKSLVAPDGDALAPVSFQAMQTVRPL